MFDTLQVAHDLRKGEFSAPQADALVSALNVISRNMVTKAELKAELKTALSNHPTQADLKTELGELRAEFRAGLADLRSEFRAGLADLRTEQKTELQATLENYPTKADWAALETRLTMRMYMMTSLMASLTVGVITLVIKL